MSRQEDVFSFGITRLSIGLSAIVEVTLKTIPGSISVQFKQFSGMTLEIVSGVSSGSDPALHRGSGYPITANEIISIGGPATFYLLATGSTAVVPLLIGKSQGI